MEYYEHGKNAVLKMGWHLSNSGPTGFVPSPPSTLQSDQIHVVRPGEWLYKIARQYQVSASDIMKANDLASGKLVPGQQLVIPSAASSPEPVATSSAGSTTAPSASTTDGCRGTYIVRPGDNLFRVSLKFDSSLSNLAAQNGISAPYTLHVGQALCLP
ncbi:MAG: LysM peptidoglycan-binding domain-containing protein [Burkholderiales bacterium]|nr:LysM peptidoglycan-binding domain-containing protein [Burkholderiales bacterium]